MHLWIYGVLVLLYQKPHFWLCHDISTLGYYGSDHRALFRTWSLRCYYQSIQNLYEIYRVFMILAMVSRWITIYDAIVSSQYLWYLRVVPWDRRYNPYLWYIQWVSWKIWVHLMSSDSIDHRGSPHIRQI